MVDILSSPTALLVHLAAGLYFAGLAFRDELKCRLLILFGTASYIAYYYYHPEIPLWDAIVWSVALGAVNGYVIVKIIHERSERSFDSHHSALFEHFSSLAPGEFAKLIAISENRIIEQPQVLTRKGAISTKLYFVLNGKFQLDDGHLHRQKTGSVFIGEAGFLLNHTASSTVTVEEGLCFEWNTKALNDLLCKEPSLENKLVRIFNQDMARKFNPGDATSRLSVSAQPA